MTRKTTLKTIALLLALLLAAAALASCARIEPPLLPEYAEPTPTPVPTPVPTPAPTPTPAESAAPESTPVFDALGRFVSTALHYTQYLSFETVQVYEQAEDTFLDAVIVNAYPETLVCAADVLFFDAEGVQLAQGQLQTRDGQYVLLLPPGETTVFAQIDTDIVLTDKAFEFVYDEALGVLPDIEAEP